MCIRDSLIYFIIISMRLVISQYCQIAISPTKQYGQFISCLLYTSCTSPSLFFKISRSICSDPGIFSPSRTTGAKRGCISISPSFFNASKTRLTVYRLTWYWSQSILEDGRLFPGRTWPFRIRCLTSLYTNENLVSWCSTLRLPFPHLF